MGIYLFVLAFKNVEYYGEYAQHAQAWRFSPLCSISGVLVMTSSEVGGYGIQGYRCHPRWVVTAYGGTGVIRDG